MQRKEQMNNSKKKKDENWVDDLMERQEHDVEKEEEILSSVPSRIRHKWIDPEEEE